MSISWYIGVADHYDHQHKLYDPQSGMLHWLHIMVSNVKAYIVGTHHGLPKAHFQSYLDEFCFRFSRRGFGASLLDRLILITFLLGAIFLQKDGPQKKEKLKFVSYLLTAISQAVFPHPWEGQSLSLASP